MPQRTRGLPDPRRPVAEAVRPGVDDVLAQPRGAFRQLLAAEVADPAAHHPADAGPDRAEGGAPEGSLAPQSGGAAKSTDAPRDVLGVQIDTQPVVDLARRVLPLDAMGVVAPD